MVIRILLKIHTLYILGCIRRSNVRNKTSLSRCVALANDDNTENTSNNAMILHTINNKGGRPKGSTTVSKLDIRKKIELAKNQIAILYTASRDKNGGSLKRGTYKAIHDSVLNELGITDEEASIMVVCIRRRICRNSLTVDAQRNNKSPLQSIEPILLQIALWKNAAGQPITPTEGLNLANSLISGKPAQDKLKTLQAKKRQFPPGFFQRSIGCNL